MKLILARHGNTFLPGEPVVWTGSSNDLPLVASGQEQAHIFARTLQEKKIVLTRIIAGPLRRTTEYAQIVAEQLPFPGTVEIDNRLMEIDYGSWTGLTNEQVAELSGSEEQDRWNEESVWPEHAGWGGSVTTVTAEVQSISQELVATSADEDVILLVSSNGRIRYFLSLVEGAFAEHVQRKNFKVKTGAYCVLEYSDDVWSVLQWNIKP